MSSSNRIPRCDLAEYMGEGQCCPDGIFEDSDSRATSFKQPTSGLVT